MEPQETESDSHGAASEFERLGSESQDSMVREFFLFLRDNKKWWLLPIIIVVIMVSLLVSLTTTGAAPFIYTLF